MNDHNHTEGDGSWWEYDAQGIELCRVCAVCHKPKLNDHPHTEGDGSWWEYDAQGIELCRVCSACRTAKLSHYRPEILSGYTQADVDERIEPE